MGYLENKFEEFLIFNENKVIIWGTGNNARECARILKKDNIEIYAYCDNQESKWGDCIGNVMILSPQRLDEISKKIKITLIIASLSYENIEKQVQNYSLNRIVYFFELYKISACNKLAKEYNLDEEILFEAIEKNICDLRDVFFDEKCYLQKLEYELEKKVPELKKKYSLSICAIVKNESDYIVEWLEYHRLVGVEHFYIYDNGSTDDLYSILEPYQQSGIITYIEYPGRKMQLSAYSDALKKYKYESKYIAFIDIDEFLVPIEKENLYEIVDNIFMTHPYAGGIGVNWRMYGTSFHEVRQTGWVIENYKYRAEDFEIENRHIKTICNPRKAINFPGNPHAASYVEGYYCISENGSYIPDAFFYDGVCRKLRCNHYVTKSVSEFRVRCYKGKAASGTVYTEEMIQHRLKKANDYNIIFDSIMDKYVDRLDKVISERVKS